MFGLRSASVKLAAFGATVGIRQVGHRGIETVEKASNQNPAGVIFAALDVGDLRLGCVSGGGQFDLLQAAIFAERSQRPTEISEGIGRIVVSGSRHGGHTLPVRLCSHL